jgi:hypothetical protein
MAARKAAEQLPPDPSPVSEQSSNAKGKQPIASASGQLPQVPRPADLPTFPSDREQSGELSNEDDEDEERISRNAWMKATENKIREKLQAEFADQLATQFTLLQEQLQVALLPPPSFRPTATVPSSNQTSSSKPRTRTPSPKPLSVKQELDPLNARRLTPLPPPPQQSSNGPPQNPLPRIERIPLLSAKLSDGIEYKPRLWKKQLDNSLALYERYFINEEHRRSYVLDNTEGRARDYLEPLFLDTDTTQSADDLIESVVSFLTNPAEQQTAHDKYRNLQMSERATFWNFYQTFRILATTGGIKDDYTLRTDLRDKITPRLRTAVVQEWRRCRNITEYAAVIQDADSDFIAQGARNRKSSSTPRSNGYADGKKSSQNATYDSPSTPEDPKLSAHARQNPPSTSHPRQQLPQHHSSNLSRSTSPPNFQQRSTTPDYNRRSMSPARINEVNQAEEDELEYEDALEKFPPRAKDRA